MTLKHPRSPISEAYRVLRTNLEFSLLSETTPSLLVTSPNPGEGKSVTAANLAVVIAQAGSQVILVDSDLRRPVQHRVFQLPNSLGMTSLLLDVHLDVESALQPVEGLTGLRVLTSGPLPPNPAEVLKSRRTATLLASLIERADMVVLDSPPLLAVADAAILAGLASGTLLVCQSGVTRTAAAREALEALAKVGVKPLGLVVNDLDRSRVGSYYYHKYYYYRRYGYYYGDGHDGEKAAEVGASEEDDVRAERRVVRRRHRKRAPLQRVVDTLRSALS